MVSDLIGSSFGLLTLHGKEAMIAPLLKENFDASLLLTKAFDTDILGTFSGEVQRSLAPHECALKKAHLACSLTGLWLGLGSEGSYGPSPYGFGTFNHELIACVNVRQGWSIIGHYYGFSRARAETVTTIQQLNDFLEQVPSNQGLILKLGTQLIKGVYGTVTVKLILADWLGADFATKEILPESIFLSYDLRAHHCPERRINITKATENLIARLKSQCPKCRTPGFWQDKHLSGLPCHACYTPTPCIKAYIATCAHCHHTHTTWSDVAYAEPNFCPCCNP